MGMSCNSFFGKSVLRYVFSELENGKFLTDPIVESVTPLFPFEGMNLVSRYLLELPKKEEMQRIIDGHIQEGV